MKHTDRSFENRASLEKSEMCGCYYCYKVYKSELIKKWVKDKNGDTAECRFCGIDSVIPYEQAKDKSLEAFKDYLEECGEESFSYKEDK